MTEPLLRRLHARGEQLTVGALPWVAPVYRAMPQVSKVIEYCLHLSQFPQECTVALVGPYCPPGGVPG
jgi:ADP-heptose:LPS heptosyltransferase